MDYLNEFFICPKFIYRKSIPESNANESIFLFVLKKFRTVIGVENASVRNGLANIDNNKTKLDYINQKKYLFHIVFIKRCIPAFEWCEIVIYRALFLSR